EDESVTLGNQVSHEASTKPRLPKPLLHEKKQLLPFLDQLSYIELKLRERGIQTSTALDGDTRRVHRRQRPETAADGADGSPSAAKDSTHGKPQASGSVCSDTGSIGSAPGGRDGDGFAAAEAALLMRQMFVRRLGQSQPTPQKKRKRPNANPTAGDEATSSALPLGAKASVNSD
ncbi:unnamed protein product, partial [Phaeothamnion confervicola]